MLLPVLALRQDLDEEGMLIAEEPLNFAGVDLDRHDGIVAPLSGQERGRSRAKLASGAPRACHRDAAPTANPLGANV
jgi:hypothetical protein